MTTSRRKAAAGSDLTMLRAFEAVRNVGSGEADWNAALQKFCTLRHLDGYDISMPGAQRVADRALKKGHLLRKGSSKGMLTLDAVAILNNARAAQVPA